MNKLVKKIVSFSAIGAVLAGLSIGNAFAFMNQQVITATLCGTGDNLQTSSETLKLSDELCRKIGDESMVLLRNENNALPLESKKVNVFGWGATDEGFLLKGKGSGSSSIPSHNDKEGKPIKKTLLTALKENDFEVNQEIIDIYDSFGRSTNTVRKNSNLDSGTYNLAEPKQSQFTDAVMQNAQDFSDTAIYVISRCGGENIGDMPLNQNNTGRTYLQITPAEEEMLKVLKEKFEKVIVLLNTTNVMHTGFLEELNIDAALYVGITGQSAAMAIPRLLTGEVTPSGKVADTYAYSTEYDPTFRNIATGSNQYVEDIYYGYKWYETADYEGYFADVSNEYGEGYDGVVQYPFGFGKSYTDFTWSLSSLTVTDAAGKEEALDYTETINLNDYKVTDKFTLTVNVTNVGEYAGKDVVQLYSTPEYFVGEVEKAHVNLLDFAKTAQIGTTAGVDNVGSVKVSFTPYDLASYDAYDKNKNGASTYELDEGSYEIKLMTDAHNLADMENAVIKFEATSDIIINEDPITNVEVKNRLTGDTAYAGLPIDGSTVGADGYMTRANFLGTFPTKQAKKPSGTAMNTANRFMNDAPYEALPDPVYGEDNGLYIATLSDGSQANIDQLNRKSSAFEEGVTLVWNEELVAELAADYNGEKWEQLLNQLNKNEIEKLIEQGGFRRNATLSVGLPIMSDRDGPAGFNVAGLTGDWSGDRTTNTKWTAFPSEALMGCSWNKDLMFELGRSMGAEAAETSVNGWYAPGVNLHRSQYLGRNFEYYSEDGVISGKLAAMVIYGAKTNGLTCFLKHFVCSDAGQNPNGYDTWLTEQTLRENALKPFEIAVKEGGSNGIMSAFNDIGTVWSGANYALLTQILRNEWGFEGTVLTDWTPATGASIGGMNVQQGIRAGNDIWLNTGNSYSGGMETSNKIDMKAARIAVHNILFTVVDTQQTAIEYRDMDIEDIYQTSGTIGFVEEVFPWWIPALIAIDVAAVAGLGFWAFTLVKPKKQVA